MVDRLIDQVAVDLARLRNKVDELESRIGEAENESMDDVYLHLQKSGGGGGADYGAFRFEGDKITQCHFYAVHGIHTIEDVTIGEGQANGTWYLNVSHPASGGITGSVSKTQGTNDDENTCIKLFEIENGEVKKDYRGMPFIPIYA